MKHTKPIFHMDTSEASTVKITFNCPPGHRGPFVVNLDLGSLLGVKSLKTATQVVKPPYQQFAEDGDVVGQNGIGFSSLPPELRNAIYHLVFVRGDKKPVQFQSGQDNCLSAAFLRTSRQIYQEGRTVLYGSNRFHFMRKYAKVGPWYATSRTEVAYSDMERFFNAIGSYNTSLLRNLKLDFFDAIPALTQDLEPEERRFVNDESLRRSLRFLGKHSKLDLLLIRFEARRVVNRSDIEFLDALTTVIAKKVKLDGKLDAKIHKEVWDHMTYPGKSEPLMFAWNKTWESTYKRRCC